MALPAVEQIFAILRPPWFIRIVQGQKEDWEDAKKPAIDLAGNTFSKTAEKVSVYRVSSAVEEALVIAALQLTKKQTPPRQIMALRFYRCEIRGSGITIAKCDGKTGVAKVDRAHRDLVGDKDKYEALAKTVLDRQLEGHDRVRRMQWNRLKKQFITLSLAADSDISTIARERCKQCIDKMGAATKSQ